MTDAEAIKWLSPDESQALIFDAYNKGLDPAIFINEAMERAVRALKCHTVKDYKRALKHKIKEELDFSDYYLPENFVFMIDNVKVREG